MKLLPEEPYKKFFYIIFYVIIAVISAYFILEYALVAALPFIIGFLISHSVQKHALLLEKRTGGSAGVFSLLLGLVLLSLMAGLILVCGVNLWQELYELAGRLPEAKDGIIASITDLVRRAEDFLLRFLPDTQEIRESFTALAQKSASDIISALTTKLPAFMGKVFSAVPKILFFFGATLISCVYFCLDYRKIRAYVSSLTARAPFSALARLPRASIGALIKYFRATAVIFLMTAAELFAGFLFIGVEYAWLLAVITAFVDVLPLFGSGAVLLPYAAVSFARGEPARAVGLLVLWGVVSFVRQITEPKIMGERLGVHPLVNLAAVYTGYTFFGVTGVIFLPIAVVIVKNLIAKE